MKVELENGKIIIDGVEHEIPSGLIEDRVIVIQAEGELYVNGFVYGKSDGNWYAVAHSRAVCDL